MSKPGNRKALPCLFCGALVPYDPELSANLNGATGCSKSPHGLHVGDPTDERPSIAELQQACRLIAEGKLAASDAIQDAAPVLLEVVAAALEWGAAPSATTACRDTYWRFCEALDKVRP